ncbi:MAG: hypothetical protein JKY67_00625 [Pseudomonadales bacterium]|nr:hypothetical protein [Pseudomonadales bacterium]
MEETIIKLKNVKQQFKTTSTTAKNIDKQMAILIVERDNLKATCNTKEQKIISLANQCETLQHEKSVLLGQLKQAQSQFDLS